MAMSWAGMAANTNQNEHDHRSQGRGFADSGGGGFGKPPDNHAPFGQVVSPRFGGGRQNLGGPNDMFGGGGKGGDRYGGRQPARGGMDMGGLGGGGLGHSGPKRQTQDRYEARYSQPQGGVSLFGNPTDNHRPANENRGGSLFSKDQYHHGGRDSSGGHSRAEPVQFANHNVLPPDDKAAAATYAQNGGGRRGGAPEVRVGGYNPQQKSFNGAPAPAAGPANGVGGPSPNGAWRSSRVEKQRLEEQKKMVDRRTHPREAEKGAQPEQWWYKDPMGQFQGPFSTQEMKEWYSQGFFQPDLPIRCYENVPFLAMRLWFADGNPAFMDEVPSDWQKKGATQAAEEPAPEPAPEEPKQPEPQEAKPDPVPEKAAPSANAPDAGGKDAGKQGYSSFFSEAPHSTMGGLGGSQTYGGTGWGFNPAVGDRDQRGKHEVQKRPSPNQPNSHSSPTEDRGPALNTGGLAPEPSATNSLFSNMNLSNGQPQSGSYNTAQGGAFDTSFGRKPPLRNDAGGFGGYSGQQSGQTGGFPGKPFGGNQWGRDAAGGSAGSAWGTYPRNTAVNQNSTAANQDYANPARSQWGQPADKKPAPAAPSMGLNGATFGISDPAVVAVGGSKAAGPEQNQSDYNRARTQDRPDALSILQGNKLPAEPVADSNDKFRSMFSHSFGQRSAFGQQSGSATPAAEQPPPNQPAQGAPADPAPAAATIRMQDLNANPTQAWDTKAQAPNRSPPASQPYTAAPAKEPEAPNAASRLWNGAPDKGLLTSTWQTNQSPPQAAPDQPNRFNAKPAPQQTEPPQAAQGSYAPWGSKPAAPKPAQAQPPAQEQAPASKAPGGDPWGAAPRARAAPANPSPPQQQEKPRAPEPERRAPQQPAQAPAPIASPRQPTSWANLSKANPANQVPTAGGQQNWSRPKPAANARPAARPAANAPGQRNDRPRNANGARSPPRQQRNPSGPARNQQQRRGNGDRKPGNRRQRQDQAPRRTNRPATNKPAKEGGSLASRSPSEGFKKWVKGELKTLNKTVDATEFATFLLNVKSESETKEYIQAYLGYGSRIESFAEELITQKAFETQGAGTGGKSKKGKGKKATYEIHNNDGFQQPKGRQRRRGGKRGGRGGILKFGGGDRGKNK